MKPNASNNSPEQFIRDVRVARADDGVVDWNEIAGAVQNLNGSDDVATDVKAYVVQDLLDTAASRGPRGGLRLGNGVRERLQGFVDANDKDKPGLWLDRPTGDSDSLSRFANRIRRANKTRRGANAGDIAEALIGLATSFDVSPNVRGHIAEKLFLDSRRQSSGVRVDEAGQQLLRAFAIESDPRRQGLGWFENP